MRFGGRRIATLRGQIGSRENEHGTIRRARFRRSDLSALSGLLRRPRHRTADPPDLL